MIGPKFQRLLFDDDDVDHSLIIWQVIQCPVRWCRSPRTYVVHTDLPWRDHKCTACGYCFKSKEQTLIPPEERAEVGLATEITEQEE